MASLWILLLSLTRWVMKLLLRLKAGRWKRTKERRKWCREGRKEEREGRKKGRWREEDDEEKEMMVAPSVTFVREAKT